MNDFIKVNAGVNVTYNVHIDVLKKSILNIFDRKANVKLVDNLEISIEKNNVFYNLKYKVKKTADFVFETRNLLFLIEQKTFALINTKPINISIEYLGKY
ncbi:MMB_0454 family protein [[Mycoplasma] gypis]|uniref:Uncharacterized protein n=1 Tax=[Mycoplasma] gypis TaxID=92404 RepID=A0ABZ2RRJ7_9BACT|nr:hypothetical protein [[Mycoplasma] gypis]MBN0919274.1 hypothetical protein [[Mycoplasma] gypis]